MILFTARNSENSSYKTFDRWDTHCNAVMLGLLKKNIMKIEAQEPLKWKNSLRKLRISIHIPSTSNGNDTRIHGDAWRWIMYM